MIVIYTGVSLLKGSNFPWEPLDWPGQAIQHFVHYISSSTFKNLCLQTAAKLSTWFLWTLGPTQGACHKQCSFILHKPCRVHGAFHALIKTDTSSSLRTFTLTSYPSHIPLAVLQGNLKENEFIKTLRWEERTEDQKIERRSEIEACFLKVENQRIIRADTLEQELNFKRLAEKCSGGRN